MLQMTVLRDQEDQQHNDRREYDREEEIAKEAKPPMATGESDHKAQ